MTDWADLEPGDAADDHDPYEWLPPGYDPDELAARLGLAWQTVHTIDIAGEVL